MASDALGLLLVLALMGWGGWRLGRLAGPRSPPAAGPLPPPVPVPWVALVRVRGTTQRVPVPDATSEADVVRALLRQKVDPRAIVGVIPPPEGPILAP